MKTAGQVPLHMDIGGIIGMVPFSVFDGIGSAKYDAVLACKVLGVRGILVDAGRNRLMYARNYGERD